MKNTIKRGLAIAAVAPLAVIGVAGAASATHIDEAFIDAASKSFSQVSVICEHEDISDLYFRVKVDLEGNGLGEDRGDTDLVRVTSVDNGGQDGYQDAEARTKRIKVSMYRNGESVGSVTRSDSDVTNDGNRRFVINKENVDWVRVQVNWTFDGDDEAAYCTFRLPGSNTTDPSDFEV